MNTFRRLILGLTMALVASVGLTFSTTTPAHADTIFYKNGPDQYGTYSDMRYATQFLKGYFGQVTWSHNISVVAKQKADQWGWNQEGLAAVAGWICSKIPTPPGQAACVYYVAKDYGAWKDTLQHITASNNQCVAFRWYAAGWANLTRTINPINCWKQSDYCMSCGYDPNGGGGGGGGGGGSWRQERPFLRSVTMDSGDEDPVILNGSGGGGSW